jgi:hypothetical protein
MSSADTRVSVIVGVCQRDPDRWREFDAIYRPILFCGSARTILARRTPLLAGADLAAGIGTLPPAPLRDPHEVVVRGFDPVKPAIEINRDENRGLGEEAEWIDDPLRQLIERLKTHFEVIRAVRFAYQGE